MAKTKIEWCDMTWNPVWGCLNDCSYCYARKIAKRFATVMCALNGGPDGDDAIDESMAVALEKFAPTWIESNFNKPFPKRPSRIFVNSMSDINFWQSAWMNRVISKIKEHPHHTFLFLTKFPEVYAEYKFPENCWLGVSTTGVPSPNLVHWAFKKGGNPKFVSIEPLMDEPSVEWLKWMDWVIVGGLTPKSVHRDSWVSLIITECHAAWAEPYRKPLFLKDNLHYFQKIQQFPEGMNGRP